MHGQKKRRKRSLAGLTVVDGLRLSWHLLSEPQWTSEHGYKGVCISVRTEDGRHRELIMEYPFPRKRTGNGLRQLRQRPDVTLKSVEANIRRALDAGWEPESRGKAFYLRLSRT